MTFRAVISKPKTATVLRDTPRTGFGSVEQAREWISDYARTTEGAFRWMIADEDAAEGEFLDRGVGGLRPGWTLDDSDHMVPEPAPDVDEEDRDEDHSTPA